MRKNDRRNKLYLKIALILTLIVTTGVVVFINTISKKDVSPLHTALSSYESGGEFIMPQLWNSPETSGESLFYEAFHLYLDKKHDEAAVLFEECLTADSKDPALTVYANYYLNECHFYLYHTGNLLYVQAALEAMSDLPFMRENTTILSNLLSSVTLTAEDSAQAVLFLEDYLNNTKNLSSLTLAWIYNYMAVTEYMFQDYDKSIRHFYDAEFALKEHETDKNAAWHLRYTREYLANIYYLFDDYSNAILKYREIIDMSEYLNAPAEYNTIINLANCYIKMKDFDSALDSIQYLEDNLSSIDSLLIPEVEAAIHDVYANIYLNQSQYALAGEHLALAQEYYDHNYDEYAFYGGKYYILLTQSRLLLKEGNVEEALILLEKLYHLEDLSSYGIENDVCQLLKDCYEKTDNNEKLNEINDYIIKLNQKWMSTIKKEYLQFSQYYEENTLLQNRTDSLKKFNNLLLLLTSLGTIIIIALIIIFLSVVRMSNIDSLTGVYNRKKLNKLSRRYKSHKTPARLGVIMIDIDYFKKYNDSYGHLAGDEVLSKTARTIASSIRKRDILIRYGGEEFLILIPGIEYGTANEICMRLQESMCNAQLPHNASPISDNITLSIGLAYQKEAGSYSFEELLSKADECLYTSKNNGRNTISAAAL